MRVLYLLPFLALACSSSDSIPLTTGAWTPIGPAPVVDGATGYTENTSGRITAIAADPADPYLIYIGAAGGGVWKTTDGGQTWTPLTDTQPSLFIGALAIAPSNPQVIYAGTGEANNGPSKEARERRYNIFSGRGILKSSDGGANWTLTGASTFERRTISRIVADPGDENVVYAAVGARASDGVDGGYGVWKSADGGQTWTNTTARISTAAPVSDLLLDPANPRTLYAAFGDPLGNSANGVYRSADGGGTWSVVSLGGTQSRYGRIALAMARSDSRIVYASIAQASPTSNSLVGVYRTTNGGASWSKLALSVNDKFCPEFGSVDNILAVAGDYHQAIAVDPANPANLYLAGLCLIGSTDSGATWSLLADGDSSGPHRDHHALAFDATGLLLDGNDGGIWRLDDPADGIFTNLNTNLQITQFQGFAVDPRNPNVAVGGTQDTGTIVFSDSLQWTRSARGDGGVTIVDPTRPARVYQVFEEGSDLFGRSLNGGLNFTLQRAVVPDVPAETRLWYFPMIADPNNGSRIVLGTNRLWYSSDAGVTWKAITQASQRGWTSSDPVTALAIAASDSKTVYAAAGGHVFQTADITAANPSWSARDLPDAQSISALAVNPAAASGVCAARDRYLPGRVFCTADGGRNWTDMTGDLPAGPVLSLAVDFAAAPAVLYAGTLAGVWSSADGSHWAPLGTGLPNTAVTVLVLSNGVLSAATHGRGAWQVLVN